MHDARLYYVFACGAVLRLALFAFPGLVSLAMHRPELSTPVTSWNSLQEGIHLWRQGHDPYEGNIYRQAPMLILFCSAIPTSLTPLLWTAADILTALAIVGVAATRNKDFGTVKASGSNTLPSSCVAPASLLWVASITLFNPLIILSTLSKSTTCWSNLALTSSLYFAVQGSTVLATIAFSTALHLSLPFIYLPALLCILAHARRKPLSWAIKRSLPILAIHQIGLAVASYETIGSWSFLQAYSAILTVQDLTPNIGLYWYFFIEMFDHFRKFFLLAFQAHLLCYALPISTKLRYDPVLAFMVLAGINATFKSYPSLGDTALYHSLLALFPDLSPHMRHPLFTIMAHLYTLLLMPTFHHLWLYAGSANSNFYYASTLVWALANGLGVMDTFGAALKLRFLREEQAKGHEAVQDGIGQIDEAVWAVVQQ